MPAIPCKNGRHEWVSPNGHGSFTPVGKFSIHGREAQENPATWTAGKKAYAARVFVGLSVGKKKTYRVEDVMRVVRETRESQGYDPDASFVSQRGIYTSAGSTIEEESVQVIIFNKAPKMTLPAWTRESIELGEALCDRLRQLEVVVNLQFNGADRGTFGVEGAGQWPVLKPGKRP